MHSRLRIAGQAIQPVLVMFPLGLFALAVIFDTAHLLGAPAIVGALAYWNILAGLVCGVPAALAGAVDLMLVPNGTSTKQAGVMLGLVNMGILVLFAVIAMVRMGDADRAAGGGLFLLELLGLVAACVCGWYAGEWAAKAATRPVTGAPVRGTPVTGTPVTGNAARAGVASELGRVAARRRSS